MRKSAIRGAVVCVALVASAVAPAAASGQATPSLTSQATGGQLMTSVSDSVTLSGGDNPTGAITFSAWPPSKPACTNGPVHTQEVAVAGNGTYSSGFVASSGAGSYRWIASYSGDANNSAVSGSCGDPGSVSVVTKATPSMTTSATADVVVGNPIRDAATLNGGFNATGILTFRAYGPDDPACSGNPAYTSPPVGITGNNTYNSPPFTPGTAGVYRWVATYSGDFNNEGTTGSCNDPGETSTVAKASPAISAAATAESTVGEPLADVAQLSGGYNPAGSVTFTAYGPGDSTCSGPAAFTATSQVSGEGEYSADPAFSTAAAGTYRWVASYSGDVNNNAASTACGAADQTSVAAKFSPSISAQASATGTVGSPIADRATLTGFSPRGTITFRAYAPSDASCAGAPVFTDTEAINGNGTYTSNPGFPPATAGVYRWVASYSGDANNEPVSGACNDPGQASTVSPPATPPNDFAIGQLRDGLLWVTVKSPGTVRVAENRVLRPTSATGGPGVVRVPIRLKPAAVLYLLLTGKLKFDATVSFTPKGGATATKTTKLTIEVKRKGRGNGKDKDKGRGSGKGRGR